jgi:hypothetical protein
MTPNIDHIPKFMCCLNPVEKGCFILCQAQAGPITYFILKVLFDAYWVAVGAPFSSVRQQIFVDYYGLTLGSIPGSGEDEIEVYFLDVDFWTAVADYYHSEDYCGDLPCKILTFPN